MVERSSRKLAVILHADVVGSTALVHRDETLAHERIQETFQRLSRTIQSYGGIAQEIRGDALVARFDRASDAVSAALAFQSENTGVNAKLDDDLRPRLRIGIGLGEVVIGDDTITGAGVVLAQRIEQLADPDSVCITGAVYEAVPQHLPFDYADIGRQVVKGFEELVQVYRAKLKPASEPPSPDAANLRTEPSHHKRVLSVVSTVAVLVVIGGVLAWWASEERVSTGPAALALPDKPSIAVLPFDDLSPNEPDQQLADGLTETLISTLGQVSDLFVIARNSVMAYKSLPIDVRRIGRELGVRYVLEGSVQQSSDQVRVTAQLIDTTTAEHLWAERYDRPLDDIFVLQDEIALKVLVSLQVKLTDGEVARLRSSTTRSVDAYLYYQKGVEIFFTFSKEGMRETRRLMDEALELDPTFTSAMVLKAWTHANDANLGYSDSREQSIFMAEQELVRMENLGQELTVLARGEAFMIRAYLELLRGNHERSIDYGEKSIALLPNHADMLATFAEVLRFAGRSEFAVEVVRRAMRVNPHYQSWYATMLAQALVLADDLAAAETAALDAVQRAGKEGDTMLAFAYRTMAIVHAQQGKVNLGKSDIRRALELAPWLSLQQYRAQARYQDEQDLQRFVDALRVAGLPE